MVHACPPLPPGDSRHPAGPHEHPTTAVLAVVAVLLAIVLISWAAVEIHGAYALRQVVSAAAEGNGGTVHQIDARTEEERQVDHAVASSRFATGLSP